MPISDYLPFIKARRKPKTTSEPQGVSNVVASDTGIGVPIDSYINTTGTLEKVPIFSFSWRWMYDLVYSSDLLWAVVKTITDEVFRNGIEIKEKFKVKCTKCGREFEEDLEECRYCGGKTRHPDYREYDKLKTFFEKPNRFGDGLIATMKYCDTDMNVGDNAYLFLLKDYMYKDKKIAGYIPREVIRFSPAKMRLIYSRYGSGRDETGSFVYFCPQHRTDFELKDVAGEYFCQTCGLQLLQAWFMSRDKDGILYYGKDEVVHTKRWSNTNGYGVPPSYAIWQKVMTLLKMDRFMLDAYSLQRSPKALLLVRGKLETFKRAWLQLMTEARNNPNMIYPLVMEGDDTGKRILEYQPLDIKPAEMEWIESREDFRVTVGIFYGVQPIMVQGATTGGGGLNNEGLEITVTNRTIRESQRVWNGFLDWLSQQFGCEDYHLVLVANEIMDEMRGHQIEEQRLKIAMTIAQFGYRIEIHRDAMGLIDFSWIKDDTMQPGGNMPAATNRDRANPNAKTQEYGGTPGVDDYSAYRSEAQSYDSNNAGKLPDTRNRKMTMPKINVKQPASSAGTKQRKHAKHSRVYLKPGKTAPPGAQVYTSSRGRRFYYAEGYWHTRKDWEELSKQFDDILKANYLENGGTVMPNPNEPKMSVDVSRDSPVNKPPKKKLQYRFVGETEETAGGNQGLTIDRDVASLPRTKKDIDQLTNPPADNSITAKPDRKHPPKEKHTGEESVAMDVDSTMKESKKKSKKEKEGLAQLQPTETPNGTIAETMHHGGTNDDIGD